MPWLLETDAPIADREQQRLLGFMSAVTADQRWLLLAALEKQDPRLPGDHITGFPGHGYDRREHNVALTKMHPPLADYRETLIQSLPKDEQWFLEIITKIPTPVLQVLHLQMRQHEISWVSFSSAKILWGLDELSREDLIDYVVKNRKYFLTVIQWTGKPQKHIEHSVGSRLLAYHVYSSMQWVDHFPDIIHWPQLWTGPEEAGMLT